MYESVILFEPLTSTKMYVFFWTNKFWKRRVRTVTPCILHVFCNIFSLSQDEFEMSISTVHLEQHLTCMISMNLRDFDANQQSEHELWKSNSIDFKYIFSSNYSKKCHHLMILLALFESVSSAGIKIVVYFSISDLKIVDNLVTNILQSK